MTPAVSVLLPVRDAARTLPEALASLAQQTFDDFELVVVDDGSRDGSAGVVRAHWDRTGLRLVQPGRVGLVAALQRGFEACRGRWVARMDADDIAMSERLAEQVALMERQPDVVLCGTQVETFSAEGVADGYRRYEAWQNSLVRDEQIRREIFIECPIAHPSMVFDRERARALGGYRDTGWPEDYDLVLRVAAAGHRLAKVPEVLLRWRDAPDRTSRRDPRYDAAAFGRCKAHFLARWILEERRRAVVWGAGKKGRRLGRNLQGEGIDIVAWVDIDPRKVGRELHGAPVIDPTRLREHRGEIVIAAVGSLGARDLIRNQLAGLGWTEGEDFWCAA